MEYQKGDLVYLANDICTFDGLVLKIDMIIAKVIKVIDDFAKIKVVCTTENKKHMLNTSFVTNVNNIKLCNSRVKNRNKYLYKKGDTLIYKRWQYDNKFKVLKAQRYNDAIKELISVQSEGSYEDSYSYEEYSRICYENEFIKLKLMKCFGDRSVLDIDANNEYFEKYIE